MRLLLILPLGRPSFLIYSMLAYNMGVLFAIYQTENPVNIYNFLYGQLIVSLLHLQTHYYNEYYDYETDRFNRFVSPWTGGSRVLPKKYFKKVYSLWTGIVLSIIILYLNQYTNPVCSLIVKMAIIWSILYSELNRICLGEITVALVLNIYTPLFGYFMQLDDKDYPNLQLLSILFVHSFIEWSRMTIMNLPDRISDVFCKKYTIPVQIGPIRVSKLHFTTLLLSFFTSLMLYLCRLIPAGIFVNFLCTIPLGLWISIRLNIFHDWNSVLTMYSVPFWSSIHNALVLYGTITPLLTYIYINRPYLECVICSISPALFLIQLLTLFIKNYINTRQIEPPIILDNNCASIEDWNVLLSYKGPAKDIIKDIRNYYTK